MQNKVNSIYKKASEQLGKGKVADYIQELSKADPSKFGVSLWDNTGNYYEAGDTKTDFTIQSISKVISLIVALEKHGDKVFDVVGCEATGDAFNSIKRLETDDEKPFNPFINAGAIAVCSLVTRADVLAKAEVLLNQDEVLINDKVYKSEWDTGDRNRALAYFMRDGGVFSNKVDDILYDYFSYCSINANTTNLSFLAAVLAQKGASPVDGRRLVKPEHVKIVNSLMATAGMYNGSGRFALEVGFPAKSGVGGGIIGEVPGKIGVAVYCPALDENGNSLAGIEALKLLSNELELSVYG